MEHVNDIPLLTDEELDEIYFGRYADFTETLEDGEEMLGAPEYHGERI